MGGEIDRLLGCFVDLCCIVTEAEAEVEANIKGTRLGRRYSHKEVIAGVGDDITSAVANGTLQQSTD